MDPDLTNHVLNSLGELAELVTRGSRYDLVRASGILRQLFVDDLIANKVNRDYRLPITVLTMKRLPEFAYSDGWEFFLDPAAAPHFPAASCHLKLRQFLETKLIQRSGTAYNVREIIKFVANSKGGVHWGPPDRDQQPLDQEGLFKLGQHELPIQAIRSIGQVLLDAVAPIWRSLSTDFTKAVLVVAVSQLPKNAAVHRLLSLAGPHDRTEFTINIDSSGTVIVRCQPVGSDLVETRVPAKVQPNRLYVLTAAADMGSVNGTLTLTVDFQSAESKIGGHARLFALRDSKLVIGDSQFVEPETAVSTFVATTGWTEKRGEQPGLVDHMHRYYSSPQPYIELPNGTSFESNPATSRSLIANGSGIYRKPSEGARGLVTRTT